MTLVILSLGVRDQSDQSESSDRATLGRDRFLCFNLVPFETCALVAPDDALASEEK